MLSKYLSKVHVLLLSTDLHVELTEGHTCCSLLRDLVVLVSLDMNEKSVYPATMGLAHMTGTKNALSLCHCCFFISLKPSKYPPCGQPQLDKTQTTRYIYCFECFLISCNFPFCSIPFPPTEFHSVLLCSVNCNLFSLALFSSIPFRSVPFFFDSNSVCSVLICPILIYSVLCGSISIVFYCLHFLLSLFNANSILFHFSVLISVLIFFLTCPILFHPVPVDCTHFCIIHTVFVPFPFILLHFSQHLPYCLIPFYLVKNLMFYFDGSFLFCFILFGSVIQYLDTFTSIQLHTLAMLTDSHDLDYSCKGVEVASLGPL